MKADAEVLIRGYANQWKVAEPSDTSALIQRRVVILKIQGDAKDGYHLVMSPEGCFTADTWHETVEDAKDIAYRIFGVSPDQWDRGAKPYWPANQRHPPSDCLIHADRRSSAFSASRSPDMAHISLPEGVPGVRGLMAAYPETQVHLS